MQSQLGFWLADQVEFCSANRAQTLQQKRCAKLTTGQLVSDVDLFLSDHVGKLGICHAFDVSTQP